MSENSELKRKNRKRKKSFLKNARKYAKKGYYGRGAHMDADTYQYFVRIMEAYREGFDNEEDKKIFVNNVFEQTEGKEIECSCNQVGCRVIEMLLPFANEGVFDRFLHAFGEDLRPLCSDRFATHVIESLVRESLKKSGKNEKYKDFVMKVSKFLLNNLEDFIWDTYGNHVIRTCIECLSGNPNSSISGKIPENAKKKQNVIKNENNEENIEIPAEFTEILKDYGERLISWPQFAEMCHSEITSGFLQTLLKNLKKADSKLLKKYIQKLLNEIFVIENNDTEDKSNLPPAFMSKSVIMLLETSLETAKSKLVTQMYAKLFLGRLGRLAVMRSTNFAVQKLISNIKEKTEFEAIFDELSNSFGEIITNGHTGILLALAQTCKRLAAKQGSFVQSLMKALDCLEPEERQNRFVICMCRFSKFSDLPPTNENLQKDKLNLHGTLIIQLLLEFNKPIKIVNSILSMEPADLMKLFSNTMGSHLVDSYVKSVFVGEKSREKLVRKMKGFYQDLAATKYGSRSFEAIYNAANLKNKILIMDELCYKEANWSNTEFGKIIAGKLNLPLFKRSKEDWKNNLNKVSKDDLFADVLK